MSIRGEVKEETLKRGVSRTEGPSGGLERLTLTSPHMPHHKYRAEIIFRTYK